MMNKFKQNKNNNKFGFINPNHNRILIENIKAEQTKEFIKNEKIKEDMEIYKNKFKELLILHVKKDNIEEEIITHDLTMDEIYINNIEKIIDKEYIEPKMKSVVNLAINKFIKNKKDW